MNDDRGGGRRPGALNREELLEMLDRLTEVASVELKINVPADQRMALSGLGLDAMEGRLREVVFFDTPDLTLFRNGVVVRARRTQGGDDDTVVKLRPAIPHELPPAVRSSKHLKLEMDVTRDAHVVSASLKGRRRVGAVREAVAGGRPLERLFTKEQRSFFAAHAPAAVDWNDLVPLGPVLVVLLKFVPQGYPTRTTIEQWHYPGEIPLVELSTKATPQDVLQVFAEAVKFVRGHGLTASGAQEPKTRKALEFFARHHPARPQEGA
jgi:hypothetical protein